MDPALEALLDAADVVSRRDHPDLAATFDYALRRGQIEPVLPGVYARTHHKSVPEVRIEALRRYEPRAVLLADAAARHTFRPALPVTSVTAAVPRRLRPQPGFRFVRRTVPDQLVTEVGGVRTVVPALAAIEAGPDVVDDALRRGVFDLDAMWAAFDATRRWRGADQRRQLVEESSGNPWSAAERRFHRLLRAAGLGGWRPNHLIGDHPVDVVFIAQRLAVEIDGRHFHGEATFEKDRWQQNAMVLAGWRVLRFTWAMLEQHPDRVVKTVEAALTSPDGKKRGNQAGDR
jgi:very-short-patch-repair endonuclease